MRRTRLFSSERLADRFIAVVVFPHPPFWLAMAIVLIEHYYKTKLK
jgi:hypothetical protein